MYENATQQFVLSVVRILSGQSPEDPLSSGVGGSTLPAGPTPYSDVTIMDSENPSAMENRGAGSVALLFFWIVWLVCILV